MLVERFHGFLFVVAQRIGEVAGAVPSGDPIPNDFLQM